ncbi:MULTISPECIES: DUF2065 family protein [Xanthomonas]|uniref:DUF2065 family protein n=1 Tax=Xanthomonas cucurbitae TaxID=56453 RepID=A0ABY7YF60_9XANT|nr:DUF2065 family protein [Xanthomonas cucurbitae]QHG86380.1 DUF2065 family protein [Xanthomonas cucurbitae]WDM68632.1 DUF2065 family protein [Xanthomonas cucurbitae]WDM72506.1 DUF2065 family protein [Xanthomonas cucurbitae]WDM76297.1 DUF2065 family protein [Xanthomonas cucurbitae]WDM78256.1 DUF2065 family protein [Xanthomonas cucurbitae]
MHDLLTALCLIFIIESVLPHTMPIAWKPLPGKLAPSV